MSARVSLVAHSSTSATTVAGFPADEPLDDRGAGWAAQAWGRLPRAARVVSSPARSCRQTAAAMDLVAEIDPRLRDWDLGRWRGRTLDEVSAAEPDAVLAWLAEPATAPHGGEPLTDLLDRAADWMATGPGTGHTVAVTHPAVIRAAVLAVLSAPPEAFWRLDIAPLTATVLRGGPGRWSLRSTGQHLVPGRGPGAGPAETPSLDQTPT